MRRAVFPVHLRRIDDVRIVGVIESHRFTAARPRTSVRDRQFVAQRIAQVDTVPPAGLEIFVAYGITVLRLPDPAGTQGVVVGQPAAGPIEVEIDIGALFRVERVGQAEFREKPPVVTMFVARIFGISVSDAIPLQSQARLIGELAVGIGPLGVGTRALSAVDKPGTHLRVRDPLFLLEAMHGSVVVRIPQIIAQPHIERALFRKILVQVEPGREQMSQQLVALAPQLRGEGFRILRPGKIARVVVVIPIDVLVQVVGLEREPGTQRVETEDIIQRPLILPVVERAPVAVERISGFGHLRRHIAPGQSRRGRVHRIGRVARSHENLSPETDRMAVVYLVNQAQKFADIPGGDPPPVLRIERVSRIAKFGIGAVERFVLPIGTRHIYIFPIVRTGPRTAGRVP